MKLSRILLLLAGAAVAAPVTWAQIERLDLDKMVTKTDDAIVGVIVGTPQVNVYDHPVAGPEFYVTTLTIEGTSLVDGTKKTVSVKYLGGFIDAEHGVYNSEAPSADDVKKGNKVVAFYAWTDNMGADVSGNALYAAHGGLYRVATTRRGSVVLGRGDGYAIQSNMTLETLGAEVKAIAARKKEQRPETPQDGQQEQGGK